EGTAGMFIVRAAGRRLRAAFSMSPAFGSSEGGASGAGLASAAAGLAFFFPAGGLLCALGVTRSAPNASNNAHQRHVFPIIMESYRIRTFCWRLEPLPC